MEEREKEPVCITKPCEGMTHDVAFQYDKYNLKQKEIFSNRMKEGFGYLVQAVSHYPTLVEKFRRDHAEADLVNAWKTVIAHMAPQDGRTYSAVPGDEREDH